MKVYLCGPMTGLPEFNYPAFNDAAALLRAFGYTVLSPTEYPDGRPRPKDGSTWQTYMRRAMRLLLECDQVFVLDGWENSRGATFEVYVAETLGTPVLTIHEAVTGMKIA